MKAQEYINQMVVASTKHLISTEGIYSGKEGHMRFAREVGAAIPEFTTEEQKHFAQNSYGALYIKSCYLKPIISAKEWGVGLEQGKQKMLAISAEQTQRRNAIQ